MFKFLKRKSVETVGIVLGSEFVPRKVATLNYNFTDNKDVDYYTLELGSSGSFLIIDDIHPGGGWEEVHPMMYQKEDAEKISKHLNYTGQFSLKQHWKWFDKIYEEVGGVTNPLYYEKEKHKL